MNQAQPSKGIQITLWIAQAALSACLVWSGMIKIFQTIEQLSVMWPWVGQVPVGLVKLTGVVDLLGAIGLILPGLLRVAPKLTPVAAIGILVLMVCASIFHIARGEVSSIGVNIVFAMMAAFIAWGRITKAPIVSK